MLWAEGYSGWGGVPSKGSQEGSGLRIPSRMAVIGRQKFVFCLICHPATYASVPAMFISAKIRALSTSPRFIFCAAARAAACHGTGVVMYQKIAEAV